jgi:hypothetical protein
MDKIIPSLGIDFNAIRVPTKLYPNVHGRQRRYIRLHKEESRRWREFYYPAHFRIENNVAVLTKQYFVEKTPTRDIELPETGYARDEKKRWDKISGADSLVEYSEKYLEAFELCELFGGWEHWGDVMRGISFSYPYMMRKYGYKDFSFVCRRCIHVRAIPQRLDNGYARKTHSGNFGVRREHRRKSPSARKSTAWICSPNVP